MSRSKAEPAAGGPSKLENFVVYQVGWFAVVLGAAWGHAAWGMALGLFGIALHLMRVRERREEAKLLGIATAVGWGIETLHVLAGTTIFESGVWVPGFAPPWIALMWAQFATTLRHVLAWLADRPWTWGLPFAAIGGPLAFYAGSQLGAVKFGEPLGWSLTRVSVGWALALPPLLMLARRGRRESANV